MRSEGLIALIPARLVTGCRFNPNSKREQGTVYPSLTLRVGTDPLPIGNSTYSSPMCHSNFELHPYCMTHLGTSNVETGIMSRNRTLLCGNGNRKKLEQARSLLTSTATTPTETASEPDVSSEVEPKHRCPLCNADGPKRSSGVYACLQHGRLEWRDLRCKSRNAVDR